MNKIRILVVDDESAARRRIVRLLERDHDVLVVGEAASGAEAVRQVAAEKPDLIFLDVQMPEMGGFKVLEALGPRPPAVIFVTSRDQHALQAFEVNAVDYLLKPFEDDRFAAALRRAKSELIRRQTDALSAELAKLLQHLQANAGAVAASVATGSLAPAKPAAAEGSASQEAITRERVLLRSGGEIYFIKAEEIDWIEAEGDYMKFHAGGRVHLLRETMANLEDRLDSKRFIRIHRSTIVNIDRVKKLSPSFAGEYAVILHDGTKLRLSRGYHDRLEELMRSAL
ncbi:MAG: response regulator transcription factor [Candidatus Didemnitutus sp.]|nr:response regulator transcription factor [Candidatus Didemnitutus sp.]